MSNVPDYDLPDSVSAETPRQLKALAQPIRVRILDLVLERAATVSELAEALGRPKSSVAHHVETLLKAGLVQVVRTRRVRAIDERFYGRTGRTIIYGKGTAPTGATDQNFLVEATKEVRSGAEVTSTIRHARIAEDQLDEFFERVVELAEDFTRLPREGDTVVGFVAAVYPTDYPTLPPRADNDHEGRET